MPDDLSRLRREYARRAQRLSGSDIYSPFNQAHLFMIQSRARALLDLLRKVGISDFSGSRLLEIGCGTGNVLHELLAYGANPAQAFGVDLLHSRLQIAREQLPARMPLVCADGQRLPYATHTFDMVLQFTALSSILDQAIRARVAAEMLRVLHPGGLVIWYDFWLNPANVHTQGIPLPAVRRYFPGCTIHARRITLAPPITRRLIGLSWGVCVLLEKLRIFNTHHLIVIQKPA